MRQILVDRFRGYGVLSTPKLPFPIDLLRRPYNNVRCSVLIVGSVLVPIRLDFKDSAVWYGIVEFNVPLDTV